MKLRTDLNSVENHIEFYKNEMLSANSRSNKIMLGKWLRMAEGHLNDLTGAFKNEIGKRWLHGEQVSVWDVMDCKNEIEAIKQILNELKK